MNTVFVKPADGMKVRFPDKPDKILSVDGEEVPRTPFWIRRIADGSVVEAKPSKKSTKE
ncbi:MAG: DUF2635 domain-containing protein [Gammaproteobacteria bacterium]|nr:DUF2635 domain-containing protein [Gammaproteobacteria bacterium]